MHQPTKATIVHLTTLAPEEAEEALGYPGDARLVAFCWAPTDDAEYDDGRMAGKAERWGFLSLVDHPVIFGQLGELRFALGSSEASGTHLLLLDRTTRKLSVLPERDAGKLLREQWQEAPAIAEELAPNPAPGDVIEDLGSFLEFSQWQEVKVDQAEVMKRMKRHDEALRAMVKKLDATTP